MPDSQVQVEAGGCAPAIMVGAAPAIANYTLGAQIDALFDLRERKRAADEVVDEIKALIEAKEFQLQAEMEQQGVARASGRKASVGISESVVPQVEDWDEFYKYIRRNGAFELLERRPAAAAFREHAQNRRDHTVPGVVPFLKRKLSLRVNT